MSEWWTYTLSDFLLFSPRVYWRMFELHTQALWPLPLAILAVGAAMLALAILRPQQSGRLTAILLAVLWAWVGWSFVWERYATIDWTAAYIAPLFAIEALLFLILGGAFNRLSIGSRHGRGRGGILLVALALGYPLLAPLFGRPCTAPRSSGSRPIPPPLPRSVSCSWHAAGPPSCSIRSRCCGASPAASPCGRWRTLRRGYWR